MYDTHAETAGTMQTRGLDVIRRSTLATLASSTAQHLQQQQHHHHLSTRIACPHSSSTIAVSSPCTLRGRPPAVIYTCACRLLVASGIVRCPTSDPDGAWQCRPSGLSVAKLHHLLHSAIPTLGNAHKFPEACLPAHDVSHSEGTRRNKLLLDGVKAVCSFA
jgi:hypothetical protein